MLFVYGVVFVFLCLYVPVGVCVCVSVCLRLFVCVGVCLESRMRASFRVFFSGSLMQVLSFQPN